MSTWTPSHRELGANLSSPSLRKALAVAILATGVLIALFDGVLVLQQMAMAWERGALFAIAFAALALGGALALSGKPKAAEALLDYPAPPDNGVILTGSVASDVVLDYDAGTAAKVYRPTTPVKLLYAVSFQSVFPYTTNVAAFTAAAERRAIAGLLSEYWFGENHVSPVVDIRQQEDGRYVFVTELVRGTLPRDTARARRFLSELQGHFEDAGLPPWQVASYNPRAIGNLIERTDGAYRIIDLESNLVSPFLRPRVLWRAVRAGLYPSFDAIDVDRLDAYLAANEAQLRASLGREKANALLISAANYRVAQRGWHASERRWASKLLKLGATVIDVPGMVRGLGRLTRGGERMANETASAGIDTWVAEGLIDESSANAARQTLSAPEMAAASASLGAHLAMSVPLRFPLGSIARSGWTVAARVKGEISGIRDSEARRSARNVHSAPVAVLGAIPGFGAFAYLAAKPFREQRVLRAVMFDQALRHMPFRLHTRLHLAALSRWMAVPVTRIASGSRRTALLNAWPVAVAAAAGGVGAFALGKGDLAERSSWLAVAAAGALPLYTFRAFWRTSNQDFADQAGSFLWATIGVGAAIVGLDMATSAHVLTVSAFEGLNLPLMPGTSEAHVLIVAAYAATGIGAAFAFRHELFAARASSVALGFATVGLVAALGAEAAGVQAAEGIAYAAAAVLATAGLMRVRELGIESAPRSAAEDRLAALVAETTGRMALFAGNVANTRWLTAKLMVLSLAVAAVSLAISAAIFPGTVEPMLFRDFGTVTFYSSGLMLLAGTLGLAAWKHDQGTTGRGMARDLWGAWGIAFVILAFDATPNFHGHLGGIIQSYTPFDHPFGFHRPSDFMVAVYGLAGLSISLLLWRQAFEHKLAILYFAGAVPFAMLTVAVDGFATHGWTPCVIEEGAELMAISFFVAGFARRYRDSIKTAAATQPAIAEFLPNAQALAAA